MKSQAKKKRPDVQWFRSRLKDRNVSQRGLAKIMEVDAAALSRLFQGRRELRLHEAEQIAEVLAVPVREVLEHMGLRMSDGPRIPVVGIVKGDATVEFRSDSPKHAIQAPFDVPHDAIALVCQTADTPLSYLDTALMIVAKPAGQVDDCVARLSLVQVLDDTLQPSGDPFVAHVYRGLDRGYWRLTRFGSPNGAARMGSVKLGWGVPILWIRP